jgi:hypothetical protein
MAKQPQANLIDPQNFPHINKIANWFFVTKGEVPGRFFYYNPGDGSFVVVLCTRLVGFYPELIYGESHVPPETFSDMPVSSNVVVLAWKGMWAQLTDNVYVPWQFEFPSDSLCETYLNPNVMQELMEVTGTLVNGEYVLTHVQPSWLLNGRKRLHVLQRRVPELRSRNGVCASR